MSQSGVVLTKVNPSITVDFLRTKKAALILRSINHPLRQRILALIDEAEKITVTELYVKLRLEQSVASQHLAILRKANIVTTTREGKYIFYTVNYTRLNELINYTNSLLN